MRYHIKSLYYFLKRNNKLKQYKINIAFVFHTEYLFNTTLFTQLLDFCKNYEQLTGNKVINTIMTGINPRIAQGIKQSDINHDTFIDRIKKLEEISTIGYHGHYHIDTNRYELFENEIHCNNYWHSAVEKQLLSDLDWFNKNNLNHNGIYAPGWYFMNKSFMKLLIKNGFVSDYSLSKSKWFSNAWSDTFFKKNKIKSGELIKIKHDNKIINCTQAFIGCHNTPFVEDFERNLLNLIKDNKSKEVFGCVSVHDDDINVKHTLNCIEKMMKKWDCKFVSHEEMQDRFKNSTLKVIHF
tara:strand:- start:816 stop:1703 length:888 start_codon:yes stop_codon:yes gene_type:complete